MTTETMSCQSKDLLVTYLYEEVTAQERHTVEAHLAECEGCREELASLGGVRQAIARWEAPALRTHVRVVSGPETVRAPRRWWVAAPLAAAAVLVLAAGAGLANLHIQYGEGGFAVRTGWSQTPVLPSTSPAIPQRTSSSAETPWRAELAAFEERLRRELTSAARPAIDMRAAAPVSSRTTDEELLRRVQRMIDESEVRQQRNLALRMTEVSRDFAVQRQSDLVQIQQGLGRLEGRTEAEAARARELMNYIMRVSEQPQQPPR
jgi:hypothetical protein